MALLWHRIAPPSSSSTGSFTSGDSAPREARNAGRSSVKPSRGISTATRSTPEYRAAISPLYALASPTARRAHPSLQTLFECPHFS
eukprot:scaffold5081_cov430-Prasinococcus_capsulatus_cf.AAC.6